MAQIYVSSANVRSEKIEGSVRRLAELGFKNIELSGGTKQYDGMTEDLMELQGKYNLSYRCHNYFPPPREPFVLNLSSDDPRTLEASRGLVRGAIDLSARLGASRYGIHAGFRISPRVSELGAEVSRHSLVGYQDSVVQFVEELETAGRYADRMGVDLYVENNVCSPANLKKFNGDNPFLLTCSEQVAEMREKTDFRLLLDLAHLKVSCFSLGLDFKSEYQRLIADSDYIHVSDNDGTHDSNKGLRASSELHDLLSSTNLVGKTFTLEIYDGEDSMMQSYELIENLIP